MTPYVDPDEAAYETAFKAWAATVVAEFSAANPDHPPFDLEAFDGCTYAPDDCRDCCLVHDLGCHHARTWADRFLANTRFRRCIAAKAAYEGALWRWMWPVRAWVFYLCVTAWVLLTFRPSATKSRQHP